MIGFINKSLPRKIGGLLALLLALTIAEVAEVTHMMDERAHEAPLINLTGAQRMLTQKISKYALIIEHDHTGLAAERMAESSERFETLLTALVEGDDARGIPPGSRELLPLVETLQHDWMSFRANLELLTQTEPGTVAFENAQQYIMDNNENLLEKAHAIVAEVEAASGRRLEHDLVAMRAIAGIAVGVFVLAMLVLRYILRPIGDLVGAAKRITAGDLSRTVTVSSRDEIGQLGLAFNDMVHQLRSFVNQTKEVAGGMSTASSEFLSASAQQAATVSHSSAAVTETNSAVTELQASAQESAKKASEIAATSSEAARTAEEGRKAVAQAVSCMTDIRGKVENIAQNILELSEQSSAIREIISTVNDIANESNILALNASIEATRAGEAGKGFGVVAEQVRNLAEQSRDATSRVKSILDDIQRATSNAVMVTEAGGKGVEAGVQAAAQAGDIIDELAQVVHSTDESLQQVVTAAEQQGVGIEQINQAMSGIEQASAEAVAGSQQAQETAQNLHNIVEELEKSVGSYRLGDAA